MSDETARKKHLGQYFTGERVGRLLAALADAKAAKSIIDPMVGSADLLVSCLAIGAKPSTLVGLELDPVALAQAETALDGVPGAELLLADAFSARLPRKQFDLVITNPPYIRYQSKGDVDGVRIPSRVSVREGLVGAILSREVLSDTARGRLLHAARTYPGTADIAVPAWILSASLVREGGILAVIAPQAWLSRNYAHTVRELLDEVFDVEVIVEDGDASWFDDAQIRTHLVIARRRADEQVGSARSAVFARATRELATNGSLRGAMRSEQALAAALREVSSTHSVEVTVGLTAHVEHDRSGMTTARAGHAPARVAATLGVGTGTLATRTLESYGWRAGQGLRTGANDFFYVNESDGVVRPAQRWGVASLAIPSECLLPAVRRQAELGDRLRIDSEYHLPSRIVNLQGWVTATDKMRMSAATEARVLPLAVARWIAQVATSPLSDRDPTKLFPDLAAVAPNSKTDRFGRSLTFWYQLPELKPRHRPELFIGRVCGGQPTTYTNATDAVIDANFSTLWPTAPEALPSAALLALLHSSWVWAILETTCAVLGGGALKVEAADLRRLALPDLAACDVERLQKLGQDLLARRTTSVTCAIDEVVAQALLRNRAAAEVTADLRSLARRGLKHRSHR